MAITVTHTKVVTRPDNPAYDVSTTEWNEAHAIAGTLDHATELTNVGTNTHAQIDTHIADATIHITTAQNTLLDGLAGTLTAAELNFVDGVTSSIQTQLGTKFSGTVTTNTIPKQTGAITQGNSSLSDDGVSVTATGTNIIPSVTASKDLGTTALNWRQIHSRKLFNVTGTGTHVVTNDGSPLFGITGSVRGTLSNGAKGGFLGGATSDGGFGTQRVISETNAYGFSLGNFTLGVATTLGTGASQLSEIRLGPGCYGSFAQGYAWTSGTGAATATINSIVGGTFSQGYIFASAGSTSNIECSGLGAFAQGRIGGQATAGTKKISTAGPGGFSQGFIEITATGTGSGIFASGSGSFAQGAVQTHSTVTAAVSPYIKSIGQGSFAQGHAYGGLNATTVGTIIASGHGSFAHGRSASTISGAASILASGLGSFACGFATGATTITASATNSGQFGQGTNATASSFQFGSTLMLDFGNGRIGAGQATPTARVHIAAGATAASSAPIKMTSGALMTTAEAGAVEFLTDAFYGTITTGAARKTFAFLESPTFTGTVTAPTIVSTTILRLKNYTVAGLPVGTQGDKAYVTDALAPTYLVTVAGGGAVVTEVFYNGTNWVCT